MITLNVQVKVTFCYSFDVHYNHIEEDQNYVFLSLGSTFGFTNVQKLMYITFVIDHETLSSLCDTARKDIFLFNM